MLIILKNSSDSESIHNLISWLEEKGLAVTLVHEIIHVQGDTYEIDDSIVRSYPVVESVQRLSKPYHLADRTNHPEDTVIQVGDVSIGSGFTTIAGPCTIESREMLFSIAEKIQASGAMLLRGGAFKPRTSPYSFQGLGATAMDYLVQTGKELGMPTVTEIMDPSQLPLFQDVDILQVGSKNMQNFELLKALGSIRKPVLLKRGFSATIDDLLMSAEYLLSRGNENVILCERGIRTFEHATRYTLDLSAVPLLKEMTHLPVIVDPSHATGNSRLVVPMSRAAAACGADGLILEVHNDPKNALCDGPQAISTEDFTQLMHQLDTILSYRD